MKSKLIYLMVAIITLGVCIVFTQQDVTKHTIRVHQHLEDEWQADVQLEDGNEFQTHLPIVRINTGGQEVPGTPIQKRGIKIGYESSESGDSTITASFSVIDGQAGRNGSMDEPTLSSLAKIRYRGNSSRFFDKKSYSIHLVTEEGFENKEEIMGMAAHDEWALNGPFLDRSLLRDYLAMNIAGQIMEYAPNLRYCELFVNDQYQGLYLMVETIASGNGRINITKPENNSSATSYIVQLDRQGKGDYELDDYLNYTFRMGISAFDVSYPGMNLITEDRMNFINQDISRMEKILYSYDLLEAGKGYDHAIDINAFAEYFIINEMFRNVDAGWYSTYYYKDIRGKLKPCVWDFNNSCDNYMESAWDETGFSIHKAPLFSALMKDKSFVAAVVAKYGQLRKGVLSEEYLINYLDETNVWLGEAINRNYEVWGYVFDLSNYDGMNYLTPVERNVTSHKQAVEQLKGYLVARGNWLDEHIDSLYQYCHESKIGSEYMK